MKKAIITGVSGQDGSYLALSLLSKGYEVFGTSRDVKKSNLNGLKALKIIDKVKIFSLDLLNMQKVKNFLAEIRPDEIYNLACQSSVAKSFIQPAETSKSIIDVTQNILESIILIDQSIKFYNAGSSECFGNTFGVAANEETQFNPLSPYAEAKASAFHKVASYRKNLNIYACTGILFNHESPLRSSVFVTKKIIETACRISSGSREHLKLGNIKISRDWGWAPEYVEAMWLMLQQSVPKDYVIATGKTNTLEDFIKLVFDNLKLDWQEWIHVDESLFRANDLNIGYANPLKANNNLGWSSTLSLNAIIDRLVAVEQGRLSILNI